MNKRPVVPKPYRGTHPDGEGIWFNEDYRIIEIWVWKKEPSDELYRDGWADVMFGPNQEYLRFWRNQVEKRIGRRIHGA